MSLPKRVAIGVAASVVILLAGGWEMNSEQRTAASTTTIDCTPVGLLYEGGEDYAHGVWVDKATGELVGFSADEDSTVYRNSDCIWEGP